MKGGCEDEGIAWNHFKRKRMVIGGEVEGLVDKGGKYPGFSKRFNMVDASVSSRTGLAELLMRSIRMKSSHRGE